MKRTFSKVAAVGCLASMLFAMPAGAVGEEASPLSEAAGETITCNVHVANADGMIAQRSIDIAIPDDASESEADMLVEQNAQAVASQYVMTPRYYGSEDLYDERGRVLSLVSSGNGSVIADVTLDDRDFYMMGVYFRDVSPFVQTLNCSIMDTMIGTTRSYFLNLKPTGTDRKCEALFMVGSATDGQPVFDFYEGQRLNFYGSCTTSNGSSGIADVRVRGYYTF